VFFIDRPRIIVTSIGHYVASGLDYDVVSCSLAVVIVLIRQAEVLITNTRLFGLI